MDINTGTIAASGVGSGIDILDLVQQLVAAQRLGPEQLYDSREASLDGQLSALGLVKSSLSVFQDNIANLSTPSSFVAYSAQSSDDTVATATANSNAIDGSFVLRLDSALGDQLATANKVRTAGFADATTTEVGTGDVTISNANGDTFTLNFAGGGDNTLTEIRSAINNAEDNFGVSANIVTVDDGLGGTESRLVLTATDTGEDFALTVSADAGISGLDSANLVELTGAQNAIFSIDGQTASSASNTVTNAISGMTFDLLGEGTTTISIASDLDAIETNVNAFVEAFNSFQGILSSTASYNDGNPGALFGDATIRSLTSSLRSTISDSVASATGTFTSLSSIGITTTESGGLALDSDLLRQALAEDFDSVANIFTAADGIGTSLEATVESYTQFAGLLDTKTDSLNSRISLIDDARERLDYRLGKLEDRLRAQFIAMDALVQSLNSTGSFLTQQLSNLPGVANNNNS